MKVMLNPTLPDNRKTWRLADSLEIKVYAALGLLGTFWCRVMTQAPTGELQGWSEREIARAAGWDGDASKFVSALKGIGLLDGEDGKYSVHHWIDEQGNFLEKRNQWKERQQRYRDRKKSSGDMQDSPPAVTRESPCDTVGDKLARVYKTYVKVPIAPHKAAEHINSAIHLGVNPQDIEAAFMSQDNLGKKVWEILDPLRPKSNGEMSTVEALKRWAKEDGK